jgi:hypothetical protein
MSRRESSKESTTMNHSPTTASVSRSLRRRTVRVSLALACAIGAGFVLSAAPASARLFHQQEGSIDGAERPTLGAFVRSLPSIAVDQSNGDVWVAEAKHCGFVGCTGNNAVDKFNPKGEYVGVQLTGSSTPQGEFSFGPFTAIAVDNTASGPNRGDLYVSDIGHGVVDRFSSSGTFKCQITGKKPVSAEEIAHECNGAAGSLTPDGSIKPSGLAVDSSGDLYVADHAHNVIDVFGPAGEYKKQITDFHLSNLTTIALDSAGNLYATNLYQNVVKFDSSGSFVEVFDENEPVGVGVDPTNSHVYVGETRNSEKLIAEYDASGAPITVTVPPQTGQGFSSLAVNASTGNLYASQYEEESPAKVLIYGPDVVVPNVTTHAATAVEASSATLHGHLDPDGVHGGGEITSCRFEYGPTTSYGNTASCVPPPGYASPVDVSANIEGLQHSSTYHFRLEAANANAVPSTGEDETFTTSGPPTVDREAAEGGMTSAKFVASINPWGNDTTCQLQYVDEATFQESQWQNAKAVPCSPEDLGQGFGDVTAKLKVTGLAHHTTYHYRFLATSKAGLFDDPGSTFETYGIDKYLFEDLKSSRGGHPIVVGGTYQWEEWEAGEPEPQAGAHPDEVVTTIDLSSTAMFSFGEESVSTGFTVLNTKDFKVDLPPGLIGNPGAVAKCSRFLVDEEQCPGDTQVGILELWIDYPPQHFPPPGGDVPRLRPPEYAQPLSNLTPSGRYPAEFGAFIEGAAGAWINFHLRTGGDYGVTADSLNIASLGVPEKVRVRVWGVPADPAHDAQRKCTNGHGGLTQGCPSDLPPKPLLTNPTSCAGPYTSTAAVDSWQEPGEFLKATTEVSGFTGCNRLEFKPTLKALPTTNVADSPSGLEVDLHVPQPESCEPGPPVSCGTAEADLKDTKFVLPPGLVVNPASASGLAACSSAQIELHGPEPAQCPDASKIGRVEVNTPLIGHPLPGAVYVATPYDNPFNSLLAIYVAINDPETGVVVKLAGKVEPDPVTGQLTTTFNETPQAPFEDFKVDLFGGSRGVLRTAPTCGTYESKSVLTPWSAPESGPPATWSDPFQITSAPGGGACPANAAGEPNSPSFSAGTETPTAGSYSPFVLRLHREDDSQELKGINTVLPPGLTAKLAGVAECPDSAIEAAQHKTGRGEQESSSCPAGSEVGTVSVGAGAGPAPYVAQGRVYLAGPYKGAPFSLAIVTPAVAGPYDLGDVVVRAGLYVNPETAQVTVKSDPIPTILQGVLLDVRTIVVRVGRPDFTLNPTDCEKMSVGGEALSVLGQSVVLSAPFQVGGCEALGFKPRFSVSTSGKTSRANGAGLHVVLTYPSAPQGTQANIKSVHVELPKALPSRLSTLNHACVDSVFNQNPAACPPRSPVGYARAMTPVLSVPLEGPAYFVSHGGQKFPELIVVLQGDGITIDLHGETFISKAGITSSTFHTVPDQPITSFELTLPQGPNSALAANGNFCAATKTVLVKRRVTVRVKGHKKTVTRNVKTTVTAPLLMPTAFTAQNGAVLRQNTKISVLGCSKAKKKPKSKKPRHRKSGKRRH